MVDPQTRRTASHDPALDAWDELERPPRRFRGADASVWTGTELLIVPERSSGPPFAFDSISDRWRDVAPITWTGSRVIAETQEFGDGRISAVLLDPWTAEWTSPIPGPVSSYLSAGAWLGGVLVYLSPEPDEASDGIGATFDPEAETWARIENACAIDTIGAITAGPLLVDRVGGIALDWGSGECLALPERPRRIFGGGVRLWTGEELVFWSGIRALIGPPIRQGLIFRPASPAGL